MNERRIDLRDNRLASLIIDNAVQYAIFTLEPDGTITSWSPGAVRITGYSEEEAIGSNFSRFFTPSDQAAGEDRRELETAMRNGRAEDTRWHLRKDGSRYWANGMCMTISEPGLTCLLKIMRDETPAKKAEQQRILLLNELNHRINNTLATVQSIADQTLRSANVSTETRAELSERLMALSEAHRVLVDENWSGADLAAVVAMATAPHTQRTDHRFRINGPSVRMSPRQAVSLALALHELTTNAIKHGALSRPEGWVAIDWNLSQDGAGGRHLTFTWTEHGGPPVTGPGKRGFGTRLLARTFENEAGGKAEVRYEPEGVQCLLELVLSDSNETAIMELSAQSTARPWS